MKKHIFGKQLSRDTNERKALFKGLINALVMQESIQTTEAKAKAIRGQVEKLITKAKRKGDSAKSLLQPWLPKDALEKVMKDLAVRFASRPGGYTRIITLGERFGDNATMAVIEFVEKSSVAKAMDDKKAPVTKEEKKETVAATAKKTTAKKAVKPTKKPTKDTKRKEAKEKKESK